MKRKLLIITTLVSLGLVLLVGQRTAAKSEFRVEGAGLEATPVSYNGPCPGLIKFNGKIQANGAGRVKYTYSRNDGASGPEGFVDFEGPDVKYVETTWQLGDAKILPRYEGWVMLKILSPNAYESNKAQFTLDCKQGSVQQPQPQPTGSFAVEGTYFIQVKHSGKVLDVNIDWFSGQDNGRPVGQFDNNNGDHQKFIVEPIGGGYFRIRAKHSGKCLDVTAVSMAPGTGLQQWQCHGGANQQFAIEPVGDFYRVRARHSGLYFDITGWSLNNSARLIQFTWHGGNNQLFRFIPTT